MSGLSCWGCGPFISFFSFPPLLNFLVFLFEHRNNKQQLWCYAFFVSWMLRGSKKKKEAKIFEYLSGAEQARNFVYLYLTSFRWGAMMPGFIAE